MSNSHIEGSNKPNTGIDLQFAVEGGPDIMGYIGQNGASLYWGTRLSPNSFIKLLSEKGIPKDATAIVNWEKMKFAQVLDLTLQDSSAVVVESLEGDYHLHPVENEAIASKGFNRIVGIVTTDPKSQLVPRFYYESTNIKLPNYISRNFQSKKTK